MKIDKLIEKLNEIKSEYGNVKVLTSKKKTDVFTFITDIDTIDFSDDDYDELDFFGIDNPKEVACIIESRD